MTRRCTGCRAVLASDHDDEMCSPCERSRSQAVSALAFWLARYFGKRSEVSAHLFAGRLVTLVSCGGRDGETVRSRILSLDVARGVSARTSVGRRSRALAVSAVRPPLRSGRNGGGSMN